MTRAHTQATTYLCSVPSLVSGEENEAFLKVEPTPKRGMPVNSVTEMNMPLWPGEYKRLVSGEECQVEAKKAVKELLERAMDEALAERVAEVRQRFGPRAERRNGYYERVLLTSFGYLEGIRVPRNRSLTRRSYTVTCLVTVRARASAFSPSSWANRA